MAGKRVCSQSQQGQCSDDILAGDNAAKCKVLGLLTGRGHGARGACNDHTGRYLPAAKPVCSGDTDHISFGLRPSRNGQFALRTKPGSSSPRRRCASGSCSEAVWAGNADSWEDLTPARLKYLLGMRHSYGKGGQPWIANKQSHAGKRSSRL
jgi:hypothetical protein